jgi:hypothetical protein
MTLKEKIIHCLNKYPDTRNSDIRLTNAVWYEFHHSKLIRLDNGELAVKLVDLYELPREDMIKRTRALLNSEGLYLPTDEKILKQRKLLEIEKRIEFSPSNPTRG